MASKKGSATETESGAVSAEEGRYGQVLSTSPASRHRSIPMSGVAGETPVAVTTNQPPPRTGRLGTLEMQMNERSQRKREEREALAKLLPEEKEAHKAMKRLERKAKAKKVLYMIKYKAALVVLGKF